MLNDYSFLPPHLHERALNALAELEDIKKEFQVYLDAHETEQAYVDAKLEEDMDDYLSTKEDYRRYVIDGKVVWMYVPRKEVFNLLGDGKDYV